MPEELFGRNSKIGIFLKTMIEEIFDNRGSTLRDRRAIILYDPEESRHRVKKVVRGFAF